MRICGLFLLIVFSLASAAVAQDIIIPTFESRTNSDFTGSVITTASSLQGTVVVVTTSDDQLITLSVSGTAYTPPSTTSSTSSSTTTSSTSPVTSTTSTSLTTTTSSTSPVTATTSTSPTTTASSNSPVITTGTAPTATTSSTSTETTTPITTSTTTTSSTTPATTTSSTSPQESQLSSNFYTYTFTSIITTTRNIPTATSYVTSSVIVTITDGYVEATTTYQVLPSTETAPTNTIFSSIQTIQPEYSTTHYFESTELNTAWVTLSTESINKVAVSTVFGSELHLTTELWTSTSQVLHTSVEYQLSTATAYETSVVTGGTRTEEHITTITNTLTPPITELTYTVYVTHNSGVKETTYSLPTTGYYSYLDVQGSTTKTLTATETIATSIGVSGKTVLTQTYFTTILSQPFSTQTIAPTVYYPNGSNIETIVVYESCSIVSKTSTTFETDFVTFSPTTLYPSSTYTLTEPTGSLVYEPVIAGGTTTITVGCALETCNGYVTVETIGVPVGYETLTETQETQYVDVTTVVENIETVVTVASETVISTELVLQPHSSVNSLLSTSAVETIYSENTVFTNWASASVESVVYTSQSVEFVSGTTFITSIPHQTQFTVVTHESYETTSVGQSPEYATTTYVTDVPAQTLYSSTVETTTITSEISTATAELQLAFASEAAASGNIPPPSIVLLTLACVVITSLLV